MVFRFQDSVQAYHDILSKEQSKLYSHLAEIGLNEDIPIKKWLCRGFAGVLHSTALEKIWDKVIGGSLKILVFVAVALIKTSKIALQGCQTSQEAIRCLINVSFKTSTLSNAFVISLYKTVISEPGSY